MSRESTERDIVETLGLVPEFFQDVPTYLIEAEWSSFKALMLSETVIPNTVSPMTSRSCRSTERPSPPS